MKVDYASAILQLRGKMNISQEELSRLLNVSFTSVNRWENGHYEPTKLAKLKLKELFDKYEVKLEAGE